MNSLANLYARFRESAALNMAFIGMTALLCGTAWLASSQLHSKLKQIAERTDERELILEQQEVLQASAADLNERLSLVRSELDQLQAKFPHIPEESQYLQALSQRATAAGISLGEFRPGGVSKQPHCKEIELRLRGTGPYASICRWLDSLGDVPRFVRISNISLAGPTTPGGDCLVDIQLDLLYGLSTPPQLASAVKP